jgi:MFS family permease
MEPIEEARTNSPELQPLLGPQATQDAVKDYAGRRRWRFWPTFNTAAAHYRFIPLLGCLLIFINEAEYFFKQVASMRAIEAMHCIEFYLTKDPNIAALGKHIPERLCKDDVIQKQLAKTVGLIMFFRMFSAVLGAVPLGQLADKMGRKPVLVLHKLNMLVSNAMWLSICERRPDSLFHHPLTMVDVCYPLLPIWALYFTGATGLIGGNFDLGLAMLFASYTDVMPSATERATLFFLTTSMQYVAQAFCPPIGGWLMNLDGNGGTPEIALVVSVAMALLAVFITIFFFPETLDKKSKRDKPSENGQDASAQEDQLRTSNEASKQSRSDAIVWGRIKRAWQDIKLGVSGAGFGNILLLAASILCATVGIKAMDWYGLVQYPVIKLGWTYPQVCTLL